MFSTCALKCIVMFLRFSSLCTLRKRYFWGECFDLRRNGKSTKPESVACGRTSTLVIVWRTNPFSFSRFPQGHHLVSGTVTKGTWPWPRWTWQIKRNWTVCLFLRDFNDNGASVGREHLLSFLECRHREENRIVSLPIIKVSICSTFQ